MFQIPKKLKKHQRLFQKMAPEELCAYRHQHPFYSLPAGVQNQREQEAMSIMEDCANLLPQRDRQLLGIYVQETFARGSNDVAPTMLNALYAPLLSDKGFKKEPLQKAIGEFLGFAKSPLTRERHDLLKQFVTHMVSSTESPAETVMDEAIRKLARVLPRENIVAL